MKLPGPSARVSDTWAQQELEALTHAGLRRFLEPLSTPQGAEVVIRGERLVNFSANDYLGLAADPRLVQAAIDGLHRHGVGSGASRLVVGDSDAHRGLEAQLARFKRADAVLLFNSGYAANLGILSALLGPEDVVFSDALNHASIIDGCRLSRARVVVYPHADPAALDRLLSSHPGRRRLVATDAIFSMDGDRAPLDALVEVCRRHGAALLVDEAHATGVLGPRGAGLCEELGLESEVDLRMGTLSKALGCFGAFVATRGPLAELLFHRARSLVFSTSLPPAICAAASEAVRIVEEEPASRETLWRNIRYLAHGLRELGVDAQESSPIFPVVLGEAERAVEAARLLREQGLLVKPIRPPTVPAGSSRLRIALSASHTGAHLDQLLEALSGLQWDRRHVAA